MWSWPSIVTVLERPPEAVPGEAVIGTADQWTPTDDVAALEAAGVTVVRYEGAEHGFVHDASRPAHRADDAADAWSRVITFGCTTTVILASRRRSGMGPAGRLLVPSTGGQ